MERVRVTGEESDMMDDGDDFEVASTTSGSPRSPSMNRRGGLLAAASSTGNRAIVPSTGSTALVRKKTDWALSSVSCQPSIVSLKMICLKAVIKHNLPWQELPIDLIDGLTEFCLNTPRFEPIGKRFLTWKPTKYAETMRSDVSAGQTSNMIRLVSNPPIWDEATRSHILDFHGRARLASVKNFQLIRDGQFDNIILQFGKETRDSFTLDFKYPMTALQAFAIALSSFDPKLGVT
jgi:hypothetical protein